MSELEEAKSKIAADAPDMLEVGQGGLIRATVKGNRGGLAHVYLQGAHVTHYQAPDQAPLLFVSSASRFETGKPIRGGVPIVFPWFGPNSTDKDAPQHGFARTLKWEPYAVRSAFTGEVELLLRLESSEATRRWMPDGVELIYSVDVGTKLRLSLTVTNTSDAPFAFEEALHTYLSVGDVRQVAIEGLEGRTYIDKVDGARRKVQPDGPMKISGETDRVYLDTTEAISVTDPQMRRRLLISKTDSASTVVWNPWIDKAKAMSDFGDDEWPRMVCIETANVADNRITLAPGASHTMRATIASESL